MAVRYWNLVLLLFAVTSSGHAPVRLDPATNVLHGKLEVRCTVSDCPRMAQMHGTKAVTAQRRTLVRGSFWADPLRSAVHAHPIPKAQRTLPSPIHSIAVLLDWLLLVAGLSVVALLARRLRRRRAVEADGMAFYCDVEAEQGLLALDASPIALFAASGNPSPDAHGKGKGQGKGQGKGRGKGRGKGQGKGRRKGQGQGRGGRGVAVEKKVDGPISSGALRTLNREITAVQGFFHNYFPVRKGGFPMTSGNRDDRSQVLALDIETLRVEGNDRCPSRVSLVSLTGGVLLDEFVQPPAPVVQYGLLSGITEEQVMGAELTLVEVQERVRQLVSRDDWLVGHALHWDLQYIELQHPIKKVIDTDHLFRLPSIPGRSFPLRDVHETVLGQSIDAHDSVCDAEACLALLLDVADKQSAGARGPWLPNLPPVAGRTLYVGGIPLGAEADVVTSLLPADVPFRLLYPGLPPDVESDLDPLRFDPGKQKGRTRVLFQCREHAWRAFKQLPEGDGLSYSPFSGDCSRSIPLGSDPDNLLRFTIISLHPPKL